MTTKYGYEQRDWDAAKVETVALLGERARSSLGPITYGALAGRLRSISIEPHQFAMFAMLGEISNEEDSLGRGMLSAYVVPAETGVPGGGFFDLAEKLGRRVDDRLAFWVEEIKRVDAVWRRAP
jgi:hypothetical protein